MQLNYIEREKNPNGMIVLDVLQYDAQIKCRILQPGMRKCLTVNQKAKKMSFAKKKYIHTKEQNMKEKQIAFAFFHLPRILCLSTLILDCNCNYNVHIKKK